MNIGLLEDNPSIVELIMTALEIAGHNVSSHRNSNSLFEALFAKHSRHAPFPYDLVIVDLNLSTGMSGLEVITSIQHTISPKTLPIIIISGVSQSELEQVQFRLPTVPILRKPFKMKTLIQLLEDVSRTNSL